MVDVFGTLVSRNPDTFKEVSKKFSYINRSYIGSISKPWSDDTTPSVIEGVMLPYNYQSFWRWADAVFRGLNSLSHNTYVDVIVGASWSVTEELAG